MNDPPSAIADLIVELRVPRGEPGDLNAGVRAVLERIEVVHRATVLQVNRVRPSPADLYVTAAVRVTPVIHCDDGTTLRERLCDGFGVIAVESLRDANRAAITIDADRS